MKTRNVVLSAVVALVISATANAHHTAEIAFVGSGDNILPFPEPAPHAIRIAAGKPTFFDLIETTDASTPPTGEFPTVTWTRKLADGSEVATGQGGWEKTSGSAYGIHFTPTLDNLLSCPCTLEMSASYASHGAPLTDSLRINVVVPSTAQPPAPNDDDSNTEKLVAVGAAAFAAGLWWKRNKVDSSFQFTALPTADDAWTAHASMQFTDSLAANLTYDAQLPDDPFADVNQRTMLELKWSF